MTVRLIFNTDPLGYPGITDLESSIPNGTIFSRVAIDRTATARCYFCEDHPRIPPPVAWVASRWCICNDCVTQRPLPAPYVAELPPGMSYPPALNIGEGIDSLGSLVNLPPEECETCDCSVNCGRCYRSVSSTETYTVHVSSPNRWNGRATQEWCETCRDEYAVFCEVADIFVVESRHIRAADTGRFFPEWDSGNLYYSDYIGEYTESDPHDDESDECDCDSCREERGRELHGYGTNVIQQCGWPSITAKDSLCFGVELEVECEARSDLIEDLGGKTGPNFILASDGSLAEEEGVEIISLPYTLENHKNGKGTDWKEISRVLHKHDAKSGAGTTNCGMHIHINRKALSPLTLGKMLVFINSKAMQPLVTRIAQRGHTGYNIRTPKKLTDGREVQTGHFEAVGLTGKGTVELRIFRGNTRLERIYKNIEFAHALVMYCAAASHRDVENPDKFREWLRKQPRALYGNLRTFLNDEPTTEAGDETDREAA